MKFLLNSLIANAVIPGLDSASGKEDVTMGLSAYLFVVLRLNC